MALKDSADSPASHNGIAKAEQDIAVSTPEGNRADSLESGNRLYNVDSGPWKRAALQDGPLRRIFSAIVGDHPESLDSYGPASPQHSRPWRTTFIRFGPISGLFSMLLAIGSIIVSLGILIRSNGAAVASWTATPSTYLAICTAVANLSMRFACVQGVVIAWWVRASRGSTLAKLHYDWRSGTTLKGALTAGRHIGLLGLACMASVLVVVDGPLLQRASTVVPAPLSNHPIPLNVTMAPEIPTGFTGYWATNKEFGVKYFWSGEFNRTIPTTHGLIKNNIFAGGKRELINPMAVSWYADSPLVGVVQGCHSLCKAKLIAPALAATSCTSHVIPVDYNRPTNVRELSSTFWAPPLTSEAFLISIALDVDNPYESIVLVTGFSRTNGCIGTFNYTICTLRSAVGEYDVLVHRDMATLQNPGSPRIVALANNSRVDHVIDPTHGARPSTLAGIVQMMYTRWGQYLAFYKSNAVVQSFTEGAATDSLYFQNSNSECPSFNNPRQDMIASLNKLMVYTGSIASMTDTRAMDPNLAVNTTITGYLHGDHNVYDTNFWFFLAAALVEVVCIALVAPTYWGWWTLGRPVSFSPLELAKAFECPGLASCNSNSSGRDVAKASVGDVRVQYGAAKVDMTGERIKLAFTDPNSVDCPRRGCHFDV